MKIALHVLLALQVVFIIVFTVTPGFICQPISAINDPFTVLVQCDFKFFSINQTCVYLVSILLDLLLVIVPVMIVSKLHMDNKRRRALAFVFLFGLG